MDCTDLNCFSETARDHAIKPRNYGPLKKYDGHARITGPCGDTMEFWVALQNGRVAQASFVTDGCGPSLACGSMASILAIGKTAIEAAALSQRDLLNFLGGLPKEHQHCALLAANTLKTACEDL
jgi:nitrogen fixation NifU-like protein